MLTELIRNSREGAEFLILAPTLEVARNSYEPCRAMVRSNDELSTLLHVRDHLRTIEHRDNGSSLKIIAADSETVSGKKASGVLIDELWLFGKKPHAELMLREATGGLASRPEGFVCYLSTQSDEPPQGVFKAKLQYARDVRDGVIDDRKFLPLIYEYPRHMVEAGEHLKPENLFVTNPNLGRSVDREWLVDELRKAQAAGGETMRIFGAKHLNTEVGMALRNDGWIGAEHWQECEDETITLEGLLEWADGVVLGCDVGGSEDIFSLSLLARRKPEEGRAHWRALNRSWFYESSLSRRQAVQSALSDFIKAGELTLIAQSGEAYAEIADLVRRVDEAGLLLAVGVDFERPGELPEVLGEVLDVDSMVFAVRQGWRLTGALQALERALQEGQFKHQRSALVSWCVSNARIVEHGASARSVAKMVESGGKIDGFVSLLTAASLMLTNPEPKGVLQAGEGFFVVG